VRILLVGLVGLVGLAWACGNDSAPGACPGAVATLDVTGPDTFHCHDSFRATFLVTNDTCQTLTVSSVGIDVSVLSSTGNCAAAAPATYEPAVTSIAPGQTAIVKDITGSSFCCFPTACPSDYNCDEKYDFSVVTSAGTLTQTIQPIHLELPSCDTICPQ
jgi:hypothetical protein